MALKSVTFSVPEEQLVALDGLAALQQMDRSGLLEEAVAQYLSLNDYHRKLIEAGIRQDDAGEVVSHETVRTVLAEWNTQTK